jgi:Spy/CpxP family protein refolding chaperone
MKKSLLKALISSVAAGFTMLFVAVGSWSMPHGGGHDLNSEHMVSYLSRKLNLTEEQEAGVNELLTASIEEFEPDMQRLRTLHKQLRNPAGAFDEVSAREAADEIGGITARMVFLKASTFAEISGLLTEEQRLQALELMEKRGERRGMWRDRMRDHFE